MADSLPSARFVGTPLIPPKQQNELRKTQVLDEQGRSRFHGAFTGGFSAGYFNTVGSAQGWQPSQYVRGKTQTVEDFMDDEDDALLGDKLRTKDSFSDPLGAERLNRTADKVWGSATESAIPGPIPKELLWFGASSLSSSSEEADKPRGIAKKLYLLSCSRESRKNAFLSQTPSLSRKVSPVLVGSYGLGFDSTPEGVQVDTIEGREVRAWRSSHRHIADARNVYEDDEDDARNVDSGMTFEVVEVEDDDDLAGGGRHAPLTKEGRIKAMTSRALGRPKDRGIASSNERWPDGVPLPLGFTLAKKHDPNKLLDAKRNACTPIPSNVPDVHSFGSLRPQVPNNRAASSSSAPPPVAIPVEESRAVLQSKFDKAGEGIRTSTTQKVKAEGFERSQVSWTPSEALRQAFGIPRLAPTTLVHSADQLQKAAHHQSERTTLNEQFSIERPSMEDLRKVFGRHREDEAEFESSEDSELEIEEKPKRERARDEPKHSRRRSPRRRSHNSSSSGSSSDVSSQSSRSKRRRKERKHRKSKKKKRNRDHRHRRRRSRSRSPSRS